MKKIILFLAMALPLFVLAQDKAGIITYVETIKMDWKPPADLEPEMKAQIEEMRKHMPKSISNYRELAFNEEMAYYSVSAKQAEHEEQLNASGERRHGGRMMRMMGNADPKHHLNIKKNKYVEKVEFFGRDFLIKDEPKPYAWKIIGEVREIAGYQCQKATAMVDTTEIVAWFCPFIPVAAGPDGVGKLPGMILELVLKDGSVTLTAESVEVKEVNSDDYEVPKGGKSVSRDEFETIRDEKIAEMREEWKNRRKEGGGGGPRHIRVETH